MQEIEYLKEEGPDFSIDTENIDDEIAKIAGPQLVVPIMNSRYALNAANARWMSLYDSLYGTDVIEQSEDSVSERYDPLRGEMVIKYARDFLDKYFPLKNLKWNKITSIAVKEGKLKSLKGADIFDLDERMAAGTFVVPWFQVYHNDLNVNFGGYSSIAISSGNTDANGYGNFEYAPPSGYYALCTKNLAEFG